MKHATGAMCVKTFVLEYGMKRMLLIEWFRFTNIVSLKGFVCVKVESGKAKFFPHGKMPRMCMFGAVSIIGKATLPSTSNMAKQNFPIT